MNQFNLDEYKIPRAVRLAFRRLEADKQRLEAEVEWVRGQIKSQDETIATLRDYLMRTGNLVPIAYKHALKRAAEAAETPELAKKIINISCPYR
jgi:hypothetical protein